MHSYEYSVKLQGILRKLYKKNRQLYEQVMNKITEIINSSDIGHYKNLRYNMKDSKRVHVGHFVLVFQFDKVNNKILFDDFDHHDVIYKKRFV